MPIPFFLPTKIFKNLLKIGSRSLASPNTQSALKWSLYRADYLYIPYTQNAAATPARA